MKFNEKSIFLKNPKAKKLRKHTKAIKKKFKRNRKLYMYILVFICFIITIFIIKRLLDNFIKNDIFQTTNIEMAVKSSSSNGRNKSKIVAITY